MKYLVITGAGSGIGRAVAADCLARGYYVFGGAVDGHEAASLRREFPNNFTAVRFDVRSEEETAAAVQQVADRLGKGRLTALLNIAGVIVSGPLADLSADDFRRVLDVNVVGAHSVTRAFLPLLGSDPSRSGQPGRVINMSSQSGIRTMPFSVAYSASKFGLEALSAGMRVEFAPFGIDVVVIGPSQVATPMGDRIVDDLKREPSLPVYVAPLGKFLKRTLAAYAEGVPMSELVKTVSVAVQVPRPKYRYAVHNNFLRDAVLMRMLPARWRDAIVTRTLGLAPPVSNTSA